VSGRGRPALARPALVLVASYTAPAGLHLGITFD
jgi:hypothetical protein